MQSRASVRFYNKSLKECSFTAADILLRNYTKTPRAGAPASFCLVGSNGDQTTVFLLGVSNHTSYYLAEFTLVLNGKNRKTQMSY